MARKYPAIFATCAMVTGIVLADTFDIASWIYLFVALSLVPLLIVLYFRGKIYLTGVIGLVCLMALSGFGYTFRFKTFPPGHIIHYVDDDRKYTIFGTVDDWPVIRNNHTSLIISVDSVACGDRVKGGLGRLLLNLQTETTALSYGDRIYFDSRLYSIKGGKNPSGLDYRRYLNLRNVFAVAYLPHQYNLQIDRVGPGHFYRVVGSVRNYITETFKSTLDSDAAALASGFLIGETKDISRDIYEHFRDSGTLHLLAVSGSNVGLVVILFAFLLRASPLTPARKTILLLMIIIFFSFLAYNQPSVVRAAVMASLVLLGRVLQKKIDLNNIIASAALIILIFKPTELFDIGFQLSFVTAWGLVFFVPKATKLFRNVRTRMYYKAFLFPLMICIIAQIVSLPLCAYYFQRLPVVAFVSNLVIVPLVSIIVLGELTLLLANLVLPLVGHFVGSLVNPFINLTLLLLDVFGSGELNMLLTARVSGFPLVLYYLFLVILSYTVFSKRARRLSILYLLLVANGFVIAGAFAVEDEPHITVFSAPGGIISVNRVSRAQVVLINLPPKDYIITERVVEPFLIGSQIRNPDIIALSGDYPTVREAFSLLKKNPLSNICLPASSRFQFLDLCDLDSISCDSTKVSYYRGLLTAVETYGCDAVLRDRFLLYRFDSSIIIFASNDGEFEQLAPLFEAGMMELVLVKPIISEQDLRFVGAVNDHSVQFIVCNRVARKAKELMRRRKALGESCPAILETSQLGAVELIIRRGRVSLVS